MKILCCIIKVKNIHDIINYNANIDIDSYSSNNILNQTNINPTEKTYDLCWVQTLYRNNT